MNPTASTNFLENTEKLLHYYKDLCEQAVSQCADDELCWHSGEHQNSIAIIMQHMAGNMLSRFTDFLTSDGEKPWRDREKEFALPSGDLDDLRKLWDRAWDTLFELFDHLQPDDLSKVVYIRNEGHTVLEAMQRQLAHYAYHTGQVVMLAKSIKGDDWKYLTIPPGGSERFNSDKFAQDPERKHFSGR